MDGPLLVTDPDMAYVRLDQFVIKINDSRARITEDGFNTFFLQYL